MTLKERKNLMQNSAARKFAALIEKKQSNIILTFDEPDSIKFFEMLERVQEYIVGVKLYPDIMPNFNSAFISKLVLLKEQHDFLLFVDRKFCEDYESIIEKQYKNGAFSYLTWADFISADICRGQNIVESLRKCWLESSYKERGLFLLPHIKEDVLLLDTTSLNEAVLYSKEYCDFVTGFILPSRPLYAIPKETNDIKVEEEFKSVLVQVRLHAWPEMLLLADFTNVISESESPALVIEHGADVCVIGSALYNRENLVERVRTIKEIVWDAFRKREKTL